MTPVFIMFVITAKCDGKLRDNIITKVFEVHNLTNITQGDIDTYSRSVHWFARYILEVSGGGRELLKNCGRDGLITLASALRRRDTCMNRCLSLLLLESLW